MQQIPFPAPYAAETVERTRAAYEASKKTRLRIGDSRTCKDCAAYRLPCGTVRGVYDPYRPTYPAGAEPGLADLTDVLRYYPNDTHGYTTTAANFRPV